jgi:glycine cleavage system H protein
MVKKDFYYTESHEWVKIEGDEAYIGITEYAAGELGEIVFVELPDETDEVTAGESFGSVEAVKAVEEIKSPLTGVVIEINEELEDAPDMVNKDAFGDGWMIKIKISDISEKDKLLNAEEYAKLID